MIYLISTGWLEDYTLHGIVETEKPVSIERLFFKWRYNNVDRHLPFGIPIKGTKKRQDYDQNKAKIEHRVCEKYEAANIMEAFITHLGQQPGFKLVKYKDVELNY